MHYNVTLIKIIVLSGLAFALAACGGVKDANKSNFRKAIQAYLDTQPGLCAALPARELPFTLPNENQGIRIGIDPKSQADALAAAGLLSKRDTEIKAEFGFGNKMVPATEYQITDAGKKALVAKANAFCTGKYSVVEVDNFTEPSNMMGVTVSQVNFRYKVENPDGWAKTESLPAAFKNFKDATQGDIQNQAALILTNNGWVHERLFK